MIDGLLKLIIDSLKELSGDNVLDLTIYLSSIVLFIWLYKEFKNKLIEEEKAKKDKENNVLIEFIELEFELRKFSIDKSNFDILKEKLVGIYPYLSYQLSKKVSNFRLEMENEDISNFMEELIKERNVIKYNQLNEFSNTNENSFLKMLEYQYRTKFLTLINPLLLALFSILIIITFVLLMIGYASIDSMVAKYFVTQELANTLIFIIFVIGILETLLNKKFKNEKSTWIYLVVFFLLSVVSFIIFKKVQIISTVAFIFYIIFMIKLPKMIIRN